MAKASNTCHISICTSTLVYQHKTVVKINHFKCKLMQKYQTVHLVFMLIHWSFHTLSKIVNIIKIVELTRAVFIPVEGCQSVDPCILFSLAWYDHRYLCLDFLKVACEIKNQFRVNIQFIGRKISLNFQTCPISWSVSCHGFKWYTVAALWVNYLFREWS